MKRRTTRSSFHFSKSLGQHFLKDQNIAEKIAEACGLTADICAIEIGAGAGALTLPLAKRARRVYAVEIDAQALPLLSARVAGLANVEIVHGDFLKLDVGELQADDPAAPYVLAGNLPYSVTTPVVGKAMELLAGDACAPPPLRMVFMVQREVADRLCADPGGRVYGAISVLVQHYCRAEKLFDVSREVFVPKPQVDSAVVRLEPIAGAGAADARDPETTRLMFALVKAGFSQRRKTLRNSLAAVGYDEVRLLAALESAGIDPVRRAETLSPCDWYEAAAQLRLYAMSAS